ncbi:MAG: hypothetical protein A3H91_09825 [Gammaproteobacteria bacterium RIFCSPLOWO2_02_FULL_61_13]|nr:MAG: hypothetical protein A3H91_09825 [Gammaproteobacteria bacterium RIFCSPLOWO2_02_FULL_61_13]
MSTQDADSGHQFSDELRGLASAAQALLIAEHRVLDRDLERLDRLVGEAAKNLSDCFRTMSDKLAGQAALLRTQGGGSDDAAASGDIQVLLNTTNQVNASVVKAVIALQFEDIVKQLIGHLRQRVNETEKMMLAMQVHLAGQQQARDTAGMIAAVRACREEVERARDALAAANPARQESMRGGEVTLF